MRLCVNERLIFMPIRSFVRCAALVEMGSKYDFAAVCSNDCCRMSRDKEHLKFAAEPRFLAQWKRGSYEW